MTTKKRGHSKMNNLFRMFAFVFFTRSLMLDFELVYLFADLLD